MGKYLLKRILHGIVSVIIVVACVMVMVYTLLDRNLIFAQDPNYSHQSNNQKVAYKYEKWEDFGYLDYVTYADYLQELTDNGELDEDTRAEAVSFGKTADNDSELVKQYVKKFKNEYKAKGYKVVRLDAVMLSGKKFANGGQQQLFAYKDLPVINRLGSYPHNLITVDNIHSVEGDIGKRGISFTLYDPVYGGEKFSPAIIGNGTQHKYLLYCDSKFPFIHQNLVTISL